MKELAEISGPWSRRHNLDRRGSRTTSRLLAAVVGISLAATGTPLWAETIDINEARSVAAPGGTSGGAKPHSRNYDPLEGLNRYFFSLDMTLDDVIFKPTAYAYRYIVPRPGRRGIRNALNNIETPVILANDMLQGELGRAGNTTIRFLINSTLGIAGLFDVAKSIGIPRHDEDFGQTLAVNAGARGGPYLVLPVLGPTNLRDFTGRLVDILFDPFTWMGGSNAEAISIGRYVLDAISVREANIETFDEIERTSIDLYAQVRSIYNQHRESEIRNGRDEIKDLPDLSGLDE